MNMFSGAPKREPSADQRKSADDLHAIYTSYVDAGFTDKQAMQIVLEMIRSTFVTQRPPTDS